MPVCVECGTFVDALYTAYEGRNALLTVCKCGSFADKYIEFDGVTVFIDMVLHKPQVYRHLLFNALSSEPLFRKQTSPKNPLNHPLHKQDSTKYNDCPNFTSTLKENSCKKTNTQIKQSFVNASNITLYTQNFSHVNSPSNNSLSVPSTPIEPHSPTLDGDSHLFLTNGVEMPLAIRIKKKQPPIVNKKPTLNENNKSSYVFNRHIGSHPLRNGVLRMCVLLVLFEVYTKWARIDSMSVNVNEVTTLAAFLSRYIYLLSICLIELVLLHVVVGALSIIILGLRKALSRMEALIAGLILSSFGKLLHVVIVIWDYKDLEFSYIIDLIVLTSNLEAVSVVLGVPHLVTGAILASALLTRYLFKALVNNLDPSFPLDIF